jgi:peptidoglycan-associated lipoprotein
MSVRFRHAPLLLMGVVIAACSHKTAPPPAPAPTPTPPPTAAAPDTDAARRDSIERAREADRQRAERERALAEARTALTAAIYFDFDSDSLTDQARSILDRKQNVLSGNPPVRIRVAGNTDERGSDEYNLALGQRRAAAAKRYLTQHGVDDKRIEIISYGEERPVAQGHDESAWSQNRRDDFEIIAGGDQITALRQ